MRDIPGLTAAVMSAGFDPKLPTFILSECCLVYLTPEQAADVVTWAGAYTRPLFGST